MEKIESSAVIRSLEKLLRLPAGSVKRSQLLGDLPTWDSLAIVEFILAMDEDLGAEVKAEEIRKCKTVQDLVDLTEGKLASQ